MRRSGTAAPLKMTDEVPDIATISRLLAHDLMELRVLLDRMAEHLLELRPDYRWIDNES